MSEETEVEWLGHAQHLCVARDCQFRLATRVGKYVVSTVGEYYSSSEPKKLTPIGCEDDELYETFVFEHAGIIQSCGCPVIDDFGEKDGLRAATAVEATVNHKNMIHKYLNIQQGIDYETSEKEGEK